MAKHHAPDMIEEFESAAERLAHWIGQNAWISGGCVAIVLAVAGTWGGLKAWERGREEGASIALEETRNAYYQALGARPGDVELPELANPQAGQAIREEFLERFESVADEHEGTVSGALALFSVAEILADLDREEETAEVWRRALESAGSNDRLRGLLQQRIGSFHERQGAWGEAAAAHEAAGGLSGYPLRYWALVDAARCHATAGDRDRALELYDRVEREAPDLPLPDHIRAQVRELQAVAAR